MLNGLDLFSGIGGLAMALSPWVRPIAYCENDRYAQSVLLSNMRAGRLPMAPIWDDVSTLRAEHLRYGIDIVYGGFPCQDISVAGTGRGLDGDRSGLIFDLLRIVRELGPQFVFLENVPAITSRGLGRILGELADLRYDARWTRVSAAEIGAIHIRERWFLLAHSNGMRLRQECRQKIGRYNSIRSRPLESDSTSSPRRIAWPSKRPPKPFVDRAGDGLPRRVDRHRGLGNAVVPKQAQEAFMRLAGFQRTTVTSAAGATDQTKGKHE